MWWWQWVSPQYWSANHLAGTRNPPSPGGETAPTWMTKMNELQWEITMTIFLISVRTIRHTVGLAGMNSSVGLVTHNPSQVSAATLIMGALVRMCIWYACILVPCWEFCLALSATVVSVQKIDLLAFLTLTKPWLWHAGSLGLWHE